MIRELLLCLLVFVFLSGVLTVSALAAEGGEMKLCGPCLKEALDKLIKGNKTIIAGECPSCKKEFFVPIMDEKICSKCADHRKVCARCLIARGWNPKLDRIPQGARKRIVFLSNRDGDNEIYSMKPDGKDVMRLTHSPSVEMDPAVSKDGRWVSFATNRDGNWEIYMTDAKGGNLRRLTRTTEEENHPSWFPDGKRMVAVGSKNGYKLLIIDRTGGKPVPIDLGQSLALGFPEVSPDGKRIVFAGSKDSRNPNSLELYLWEMKDTNKPTEGELKRLTDNGNVDSYPSFSPDGKRIAFVSNRNGDDDVFIMNADGAKVSCLVKRKGLDSLPWFSPDGKKVAYVSLVDKAKGINGTEIFTVTLRGKKIERITNNDWKETTFRWR